RVRWLLKTNKAANTKSKELKIHCVAHNLYSEEFDSTNQGSKQRTSHTFWNPADNWT
ncbi:unnamed protein product, partial [Brassica rapa subsp. narinosa]